MKALGALGDRLLVRVLPERSAAACWPSDPWVECDYEPGSYCALNFAGSGTVNTCHFTCYGHAVCQSDELSCCATG